VCVCVCVLLGFERRALHLVSKHSTTWAVPLVFFALVCFSDRISLLPGAVLSYDPPVSASCIFVIADMCHHTQFVSWDSFLLTFLPMLSLNCSLIFSASQVAGITEVNHDMGPSNHFFFTVSTNVRMVWKANKTLIIFLNYFMDLKMSHMSINYTLKNVSLY
jgi:hypothetical protein